MTYLSLQLLLHFDGYFLRRLPPNLDIGAWSSSSDYSSSSSASESSLATEEEDNTSSRASDSEAVVNHRGPTVKGKRRQGRSTSSVGPTAVKGTLCGPRKSGKAAPAKGLKSVRTEQTTAGLTVGQLPDAVSSADQEATTDTTVGEPGCPPAPVPEQLRRTCLRRRRLKKRDLSYVTVLQQVHSRVLDGSVHHHEKELLDKISELTSANHQLVLPISFLFSNGLYWLCCSLCILLLHLCPRAFELLLCVAATLNFALGGLRASAGEAQQSCQQAELRKCKCHIQLGQCCRGRGGVGNPHSFCCGSSYFR